MQLITNFGSGTSPARVRDTDRAPLRVGAVQHHWDTDLERHLAGLDEGIRLAAENGARIVFLQELTLARYFADVVPDGAPDATAEDLPGGPTHAFATAAAARHGVHVHASVFERAPEADGRGFNTAFVVAPDGTMVARTRKLHIPVTAGYYEDRYFRPGPAADDPYPVLRLGPDLADGRIGLPTCWDQWFPEVARAYSLAGAEVLVYPTAIGSEPDHPEFDTQPLWQQVIVGNGIANGTFMVVVNRIGDERLQRPDGTTTGNVFYGSSFISDPYGRVLVQAPRDEPAVLVADLDLDQRRDWLDLFPFLGTRRPDTYGRLTDPVEDAR
ncbi:nitrilase-related carbon-nitrogen hydrolase [Patulibacter sp.]|uniref:nitrilase-related carbon-nitrogen hydrolase n=1 Tax=Patulibacter sp. TaxID=1912859 RepID=UPI00271CD681|nr:nitrilase-related carbon-nitrogen hydrolase [Patulibacter sp.]MDO9410857.1 nitrilase-related carbon-nitrogen hydrolase [Patulibacter sp.]